MIAVRAVIQELRQAGLTVNPGNCALGQLKTKYLGFLVGQGQIKPLADKVDIIKQFKVPQTKKQMQVFLRLASYYRRFIPKFAEHTIPLTNAVKGKGNGLVMWGDEQYCVFEVVKRALCQDVILHTLNFTLPFVLQVDASGQALGAVLSQKVEGDERPVVYTRKKLNEHEKRYATIERECLALRWGIEYFCYYLLRQEFTVITDHVPLKWLKCTRMDNSSITR